MSWSFCFIIIIIKAYPLPLETAGGAETKLENKSSSSLVDDNPSKSTAALLVTTGATVTGLAACGFAETAGDFVAAEATAAELVDFLGAARPEVDSDLLFNQNYYCLIKKNIHKLILKYAFYLN